MSMWRRRLQALHKLGPGRHPGHRFDLDDSALDSARTGLYQAVAMGYITKHEVSSGYTQGVTYSVSALGQDLLDGRIQIKYLGPTQGKSGRSKCSIASTWLASLPRANEIKLRKEVT